MQQHIVRQMFDPTSFTYTYLIASGIGREGILIDPVDTQLERYLTTIKELDLHLVAAIDTHTHADHISARCDLRRKIDCAAIMGEQTEAECVTLAAKENEVIAFDGLTINPIYTPGHTNDSYCFLIDDAVYTGDTLFIRGTGRTDFQGGDAGLQYDSITEKLFTLPESTTVYPGHDYNGQTSSSIYEEKNFNPRLSGATRQDYIETMNNLNLPKPKRMDEAVPANLSCHCK